MTHLQSIFGALSEPSQPLQQQQQQQPLPQQNQNLSQSMQTKPSGQLFNQQSNLFANQQQAYNNAYQPTNQMPCNPFGQTMMTPPAPSSYTSSSTGCYIPPNLLDQLRCLTNNPTPIFILPAGLTSSSNSSTTPSCTTPCFSPTCIPYPMPMPIYQNFGGKSSSSESNCKCTTSNSTNNSKSQSRASEDSWQREIAGVNWNTEHECREGSEGTVCSKKNCSASIQLQAMISQLLAIQGVIPSAITRILLKRVPGSNIHDSVDEIMEKATRCIRQLPKDGLLRESSNSREVTKLLGLYLTASSTIPRIIPVLTTVQLKCNVLKALVENLVGSQLMQEQKNCSGIESEEPLDRLLLELKSEDELRRILAGLRDRECDERVNASFAACASQSRIAEARLASVQRKIRQIEDEIQRRRCDLPVERGQSSRDSSSRHLPSLLCGGMKGGKILESPDSFAEIRVTTSPKRLLLKPHVGSPETTYERPSAEICKSIAFEQDDVKEHDCVTGVDAPRDDDNACDAESASNVVEN